MKVLYCHQYFSTPDGAAGTRSYALARSLVEAGHQVQMVCLRDAITNTGLSGPYEKGRREGFVDGIHIIEYDIPYSNYHTLLKRAITFCRYSWQSLGLALASDADLIFATSTPLTAGIPGIGARWLRGIPFIFEVRDLWPELPHAMGVVNNPLLLALLSILEWISYHSADACIGLAPGICEGIADRGKAANEIFNIPNACDLDLFKPLPRGATKRPHLTPGLPTPFPENSFLAAFTGAHGKANGLNAVLDVSEELLRRNRDDIKLLFIGDGRCKPDLQFRVNSENLNNCHFLPSVPKPVLARILRENVHVGLMILENIPTFYKGTSPNKFFDYLSSGIPVLNNYPGWLADLIKDNELGVVVNPGDPSAFASALIRLADNSELLDIMGSNARLVAESQFSRVKLASEWRQVLETTSLKFAGRRRPSMSQQVYECFKDLFDRVFALACLIFLSPLMACVAIFIYFHLGSPILFCQQRPGYKGKPFLLYKFRTMSNARDVNGGLLPDVKRLNKFGRFLRSASIDELPELINILRGEMSFVGPRPLLMEYLPLYSEEQARRHEVKPGMSGWAQINGRNSISWGEKHALDNWYVENKSLVLDFIVIWRSLFIVLGKKGINSSNHATMENFNGHN